MFEKKKQDKKRIEIILDKENEKRLLEIIDEIKTLLSNPFPKPKFNSKCKRCAYYEYCFL